MSHGYVYELEHLNPDELFELLRWTAELPNAVDSFSAPFNPGSGPMEGHWFRTSLLKELESRLRGPMEKR